MKSAFYKIKTENSTYPETPVNPSRQGITYSLTLEKFQWVLNILWDTREFVGCCSSWNNDDFWHWPCLSEVPDDLFSFLGIFFQTWRLADRFRVSDFFPKFYIWPYSQFCLLKLTSLCKRIVMVQTTSESLLTVLNCILESYTNTFIYYNLSNF